MSKFAQWEDGESKLRYQGQLRKEEILQIADRLVSPRRRNDDKVYQAASLDLTVGAIFTQRDGEADAVGLDADPSVNVPDDEQPYVLLSPGEVAIVVTREEISLPLNIIANSLPVMSRTRDGILVLSHGHIDPGYRGYLVVRLLNMSSSAYKLRLGARIITLTLEQLSSIAEPYTDDYKDWDTVVGESKLSVEQTFPGAVLLDIQGRGLQQLIESNFEPLIEQLVESNVRPLIDTLQREMRRRLLFAVGAAAVLGALVATLVPAIMLIIQGFFAPHK
jgi:deoxycytidine triphosphate deaminase